MSDVLSTLDSLKPTQPAEVILWGHSLGTGIALSAADALLKQGKRCKGVVLEAPRSSEERMR